MYFLEVQRLWIALDVVISKLCPANIWMELSPEGHFET